MSKMWLCELVACDRPRVPPSPRVFRFASKLSRHYGVSSLSETGEVPWVKSERVGDRKISDIPFQVHGLICRRQGLNLSCDQPIRGLGLTSS